MSKSVMQLLLPEIDRYHRFIEERALLEKELSIVNAKLNQVLELMFYLVNDIGHEELTRKDLDAVSEALHGRGLRSFANLSKQEEIRWQNVTRQSSIMEEWKLDVFYDYPDPLFILISYPEFPQRTIDIIQSIHSDVKNIAHPIILRAIERYRQVAMNFKPSKGRKPRPPVKRGRLSSETAYYCLQKISDALRVVKNPNDMFKPFDSIFRLSDVDKFGLDYFEVVADLVRSPVFRGTLTNSNKVMKLRIGLKKNFPAIDHAETLAWIASRINDAGWPRRCMADILRNDFWAWKWNVKQSSAKVYVSKLRKLSAKLNVAPVSQQQIEKAVDEVFRNLIPSEEMPGDLITLGLTFKTPH